MPRMAWRGAVGAWAGVVLAVAAGQARGAATLEGRIAALLGDPQLRGAAVGIDVVELTARGGETVYGHNADVPLAPASCTKLLTTTAAFAKYGPKATFKTQLYKVGDDLLLVGSGDPGLGDAKLCAAAGLPVTHTFDIWAESLKAAGITHYRDLIVDDRVFDQEFVHPDWPKDQLLAWYEAPVGGLNFNANCLDWRPTVGGGGQIGVELTPPTSYVSVTIKATRGAKNAVWLWRPATENRFEMRGTVRATALEPESVSIVDPGLWTGTVLRDVFAKDGVAGSGTVKRIDAQTRVDRATLLATNETALLRVIERANTNSVNMMAEALCKRLGYDATGRSGSWESGTKAVEAYVRGLGVPAGLVDLQDGSGLSAADRVAPRAFATVLAHVAGLADGDKFIQTLAVPGEDGTLQHRFRDPATHLLAGHIHAKTGHISGVSCLAGYLDVPQAGGGERRFAFAILCNHYKGNVNGWQEKVCAQVYDWAAGK